MFDIIKKTEYFDLLNAGHGDSKDHTLKGIQDAWAMEQLHAMKNKRIMEVGGGNSRILPQLAGNQLWNAEKFEGVGNGPTTVISPDGVTVIPAFMGEFHKDMPVVDVIFSISVVEHIPFDSYKDAYADMARCLAPGGSMYHAVDLPLADHPLPVARQRIELLRSAIEEAGLKWRVPPAIRPDTVFTADMASNSDLTMWIWSRISEASANTGPSSQIVTIKMIADKPAP